MVSNNKVVREGEDKPGKPMALKHGAEETHLGQYDTGGRGKADHKELRTRWLYSGPHWLCPDSDCLSSHFADYETHI